MSMDEFEKHLNQMLQDPTFKIAWGDSEAAYNLIKALVKARNDSGLTQHQLSDKTVIDQAILKC